MGIKSLRYAASHEAGHAVIACRNGFTLKSILLWRDPFLEKWEGAVQYEPKSWICGTFQASLCDAVGAEEFAQLNDICSECREEQLRYICRCLAGGACTELLEPAEHDPSDSGFDNIEAFKLCPNNAQSRLASYLSWMTLTQWQVAVERPRIEALRDQLIKRAGQTLSYQMTGDDAAAIILATTIA
jgi:hypothetical protein